MFSDIITYEDFNGGTQSQQLFFNISKMEGLDLEASHPEGYSVYLQEIVDRGEVKEILGVFKEIVKLSYGVKSEDGKRFVKSEEAYQDFVDSPAYDEFMMKLLSESDYALNFILGALPNVDGLTKESILKELNLPQGQ